MQRQEHLILLVVVAVELVALVLTQFRLVEVMEVQDLQVQLQHLL